MGRTARVRHKGASAARQDRAEQWREAQAAQGRASGSQPGPSGSQPGQSGSQPGHGKGKGKGKGKGGSGKW